MRMETFYKIILGIREFPGCADLLLTYDDQEILGMIGEGGSGLIYSAGKVVRQGENYVKENVYDNSTADCT